MTTRPPFAALLAALIFAAAPAPAQDRPAEGPAAGEDPFDMDALKEEFDRAWEKLAEEVGPALDRLGNTYETLRQVDDLGYYEDPVILENGDILIRRRADAPPLPPLEEEAESPYGEGGTEL